MAHDYYLESSQRTGNQQIDYASELNEQQFAAVTARGSDGSLNSGPVLVIAGAGSGKTRTLTYRVAWLVENGILPSRILLLTFTNKAAREMLRRVEYLLPTDVSALWGGTFHHVANRILRRHASLIGFQNNFTILDREDSKDMIDACISKAGIDTKRERFPKGDVLAEIYSLSRNTERTIEQIVTEQYDYFIHLVNSVKMLQAEYTERKLNANAMDYDDLLLNATVLLRSYPDVCSKYQEQFQHVLVDEYQDTNKIQSNFIDLLAIKNRNVMVVGDDAQSIYSWRGANYLNIIGFPERYSGTKIFKIEVNYRSIPHVLTLANSSIRTNLRQFEKNLRPARAGGRKPWLIPCSDTNEQARFIAQRLLDLKDEGISLSNVGILYRAHYHSMELQMELTRRNIPYVITSGLRFFEQAHVKDVASFLKVIANPGDEMAFKRILRLLQGIGGKTASKLSEEFRQTLLEKKQLPSENNAIPKKAREDWKELTNTLNTLGSSNSLNTTEMIEQVLDGFYSSYLKAKYPNARAREEDIHQLAAFARQYDFLSDFLSQLALLTNIDVDDETILGSEEPQFVRLSTVHQAKGLEWYAVFVMGLCEGMFPLARSLENIEAEEEERRLFYVAATRAKDELYLTYPMYRLIGGEYGGFQHPSRFIREIPKENYEEVSLRHQKQF